MEHRARTALALLGLSSLASLCFCSSTPQSTNTTGGTPGQTYNIAWISKGQCNSFFVVCREGAKLAGTDLTAAVKATGGAVNVQLLEPNDCVDGGSVTTYLQDGAVDPCSQSFSGLQAQLIQQAIDMKFDAIAVDVSSPTCEEPTINAAVAAGIPVITFDSDDTTSNRTTYYGINNVAAASSGVDVFASLIGPNGGKVLVMTSMTKDSMGNYKLSTSQSYVDRYNGFTTQMAMYPQLQIVGDPLPCIGNDPGDSFCAQQVEAALKANPDVVGLYLARGKILRDLNLGTTAPTYTAMRASGQLKVVAFDAPSDAVANIQAGYADLVINQKLFGFGYDVVTLGYDIVAHHLQTSSFTDSGWDNICPNNIGEFVNDLTAEDFRQPLSKCMYLK